jgi:hypothetical protein
MHRAGIAMAKVTHLKTPKSQIIRYIEKGFNFSLSSSNERNGDNLPIQFVTALRNTLLSKSTEILRIYAYIIQETSSVDF